MESAATPPVPVNRAAIVLTVALATAVGMLPWVLVIGRPLFVVLFALLAAILGALPLRAYQTYAHRRPTFMEYALGGGGVLLQPAVASLLGIFAFVFVRWASGLSNRLFDRLGWELSVPPRTAALNVSLVIVLIMLLGLVSWAKNLTRQLYPQTAGVPSAFYELVHGRQRRRLLWILAGLLVLLLVEGAAAFLLPDAVRSFGWNLALAILLVFIASPLAELGEGTVSEERGRALDALAKLFEHVGYEVTLSPRTGRAELDPLLTNCELYAESPLARYAVEVRHLGRDPAAILRAADDLATAAWALDQSFLTSSPSEGPGPTEPLLVLVGADDAKILDGVSRRTATPTAHLSDSSVFRTIRRSRDEQELRQLAVSRLGIRIEGLSAAPPEAAGETAT